MTLNLRTPVLTPQLQRLPLRTPLSQNQKQKQT